MKKYRIISFILVFLVTFNCKAQTKIDNQNIIDEFVINTNKDAVTDKIVVYKNLKVKTDFEQEHFQLPVKIYQEINATNYKLWYENNLLLYKNDSSCTSEGYSNIVVKNNYLQFNLDRAMIIIY